jgi:hypothetical protein
MVGKPVKEVLDKIDLWGPPIYHATADAIDLHVRRSQRDRAPGDILLFQSLGGHACLGMPVIEILHQRFPSSLIVGFTLLSSRERQRYKYSDIKEPYESRGVYGWVMTDNLGEDAVTADYGMVAVIVGLADASLHADQPTPMNNAFAATFTNEPGAVLVYQVAFSQVIARPLDPMQVDPPHYYVWKQSIVEQVVDGLHKIEDGLGVWSVDLPVGEADCTIFDLVITALRPWDITAVQDDVVLGIKLRAGVSENENRKKMLYGTENYELQFAGIAVPVDPVRPLCPVTVIRLAAVTDGAKIVPEITVVPRRRQISHSLYPNGRGAAEPEQGEPATAAQSNGRHDTPPVKEASPDDKAAHAS